MLLRSSGGRLGGDVGGAVAGTDEVGSTLTVWVVPVADTDGVVFDENKAELLRSVLEEKEIVLNEIVGKRLKTVDFSKKGDEKVVVLYVIEVILRVEVSRVVEGNALLVSLEV